jgi:hypothetical protein
MTLTHERHLEVVTPKTFLDLSADIAYRLTATAFDPMALLDILYPGSPTLPFNELLLVRAIDAIHEGYGEDHRRLGPLAVVHPLRTATLLSRIAKNPSLLEMLLAILHDQGEDLTAERIGNERFDAMSAKLRYLQDDLGSKSSQDVDRGVSLLTRVDDQSYCAYLAQLIEVSTDTPCLMRVKMADRLDNTLDIGTRPHGIPGQGTYGLIFNTLFLPQYQGLQVPPRYVRLSEAEGVQVLANLFKNTLFLSLVRSERCDTTGTTGQLCDALIRASIRIAQFLVQDAFTSTSAVEQRAAMQEVRDYCCHGGLEAVREGGDHPLDGLFLDRYGEKDGRKGRLQQMFANRDLLLRVSLMFLAIFASFLNDTEYHIKGIGQAGVWAVG